MPKNLECRNEFGIWSRARSPGIHAWQLSTGYVKNMKICEMKKNKDPPTPWGGSQIQNPPNSGFATAIPQGAPLSTEHFKNDDSALDGLQSHSEHLLRSLNYCSFSVFAGYGQRLVKYLAGVRPPAFTKNPNFWASTPPPSPE